MITPFAPGGGTDILGRLIGPQVSESLGQTIVVDNRPGGGGTIGAGMVVRADPDGYTLILVSGSYGANAALHKLPYDSVSDIQPIILIGTTGLVVTLHPSVPIKSMKELIASIKANPGKYNFGSAGTGGLGHLASELFKLETKTNFTHVPYKGTGPVMTALLSGEVQSSFSSLVPSIPHVRAGRLRALGVTTPKRSRAMPDVPAIAETVPGYEVIHWYGIWGPKGLPKDIVTRWNREVARVLNGGDAEVAGGRRNGTRRRSPGRVLGPDQARCGKVEEGRERGENRHRKLTAKNRIEARVTNSPLVR